ALIFCLSCACALSCPAAMNPTAMTAAAITLAAHNVARTFIPQPRSIVLENSRIAQLYRYTIRRNSAGNFRNLDPMLGNEGRQDCVGSPSAAGGKTASAGDRLAAMGRAMAYETIKLEIDRHIAVLSLNRPDKMNALSRQLQLEMQHALDQL